MFDLNRRAILGVIIVPIHIKHVNSNVLYQGQPIKDMIGVVINCLVGMGI